MKELTYADKYTKEAVDVLISEIGLIIRAHLDKQLRNKRNMSVEGAHNY